MKKIRKLVLFLLLFQTLHSYADNLSYYRATIWTSKEGLPQNSVQSLIQAKNGYLWFATLEGLVRFDGYHFKIYNAQTYPGKIIYDRFSVVAEDRQGILWATTDEGGIYQINGNHIDYTRLFSTESNQLVTSILALPDGSLLLGTTDGLLKMKDKSMVPWFKEELEKTQINKMILKKDGVLWIATDSGLFNNEKKPEMLEVVPFTKGKKVTHFDFGSRSNAVLILDEELYEMEGPYFRNLFPPKELRAPNNVMIDENEQIWIGTNGYGAWYLNGLDFKKINTELNIKQDVIFSLFQDDEANVWLGTNGGGLIKLTQSPFENIHTSEGLNHPIIWSISQSKNKKKDEVWVATNFGINRLVDGKIQSYSLKGIVSQITWVVASTSQGVFAGSENEGLFQLDEDQKAFVKVKEKQSSLKSIRVIFEDSDSNLWIGGTTGLIKMKGKSQVDFTEQLPNTFVKTAFEDKDGAIWFGTMKGLFKIDRQNKLTKPIPEFPEIAVRFIQNVKDEGYVISTEGLGLFFYLKGKLINLTNQNGLNSNTVSNIVLMDDTFWYSTNTGVGSFKLDVVYQLMLDPNETIPVHFYNDRDGMASAETNGGVFPNILTEKNSRIWYPTMQGISILDIKKAQKEQAINPRILVDEVLVNGLEIPTSDTLLIKSNGNNVMIRFSVIHFAKPDQFHYAYRLGLDKQWISLGKNTEIMLNQLSPGKQRLQFSVWDGEKMLIQKQVELQKAPRFVESNWFYLLLIAVVLSFAYVLYKLRVRQLQKNEQQLNMLIYNRTQELEAEKEKSERALVKLAKTNEQLKAANKTKNNFLSIAAHDLRNPLNGIMGFAELLMDETENVEDVRQMSLFIVNNADKMLTIINRILEQGKMEDAVLSLELEKVNLNEIVKQSIEGFYPITQKKAQQIEFVPGENVNIYVDPFWIGECVDNLISNASKYSDSGSKIIIRTFCENNEVIFEIQDFGYGIDEKEQEQIFEPYYRLNYKPSGDEPSSGLGLSIVKHVMLNHHAYIDLKSKVGEGSIFRLRFQPYDLSIALA